MKVGQIMILIVIFLFVFYYMYLFVHVKWAKAIWLEGPEYVCYFWEVFGRKTKYYQPNVDLKTHTWQSWRKLYNLCNNCIFQ